MSGPGSSETWVGRRSAVVAGTVALLIICAELTAWGQSGATARKVLDLINEANQQATAAEKLRLLRAADLLCHDPELRNSDLYPSLVAAYVAADDVDSAKSLVEKMNATGAPVAKLAETRMTLARGYLKAKQFKSAAQQLDPVIATLKASTAGKSRSSSRMQQDIIDALELDGEVLLELGDAKTALGILQECEERRKSRQKDFAASISFALARAYAQLAMPDEALAKFSEAYRLAQHRANAIRRHMELAGPAVASQYSSELSEMEQMESQIKEAARPPFGARGSQSALASYLDKQLAEYDIAFTKAELDKASVNKPAPPFALATLVGPKVSLSDLVGKVVLLNFWDTSCKPCRAEYPHLLEIYKEFQGAGVVVYMISLDTNVAEVKPFADKYGFTSQVLLKDNSVQGAYGVSLIPHTVIIDRAGKIRFSEVGFTLDSPDLFRAEIRRLLEPKQVTAASVRSQSEGAHFAE